LSTFLSYPHIHTLRSLNEKQIPLLSLFFFRYLNTQTKSTITGLSGWRKAKNGRFCCKEHRKEFCIRSRCNHHCYRNLDRCLTTAVSSHNPFSFFLPKQENELEICCFRGFVPGSRRSDRCS
jgi:hypothetical protein